MLSFKEPLSPARVIFKLGEAESGPASLNLKADGKATLFILRRDRELHISQGENILASFTEDDKNGDLQLWIGAEGEPLRLDSILVSRGAERFSFQPLGLEVPPEV